MLSEVALGNRITIVGGSMPERRKNGQLYNTCCAFGPDGNLKAKHSKVHLFDVYIPGDISFKESDNFASGDQPTIVNTGSLDLDFSFLEMNPFTLVNGEPYPLDMRAELDDTAAFKNFKKWGDIEFPLPFGRVLSPTESFIHSLDEKKLCRLEP